MSGTEGPAPWRRISAIAAGSIAAFACTVVLAGVMALVLWAISSLTRPTTWSETIAFLENPASSGFSDFDSMSGKLKSFFLFVVVPLGIGALSFKTGKLAKDRLVDYRDNWPLLIAFCAIIVLFEILHFSQWDRDELILISECAFVMFGAFVISRESLDLL